MTGHMRSAPGRATEGASRYCEADTDPTAYAGPQHRAEWDAWHDGFHSGFLAGTEHAEHEPCRHAIAECAFWVRFRADTWRIAAANHGAAWADYLLGIDRGGDQ